MRLFFSRRIVWGNPIQSMKVKRKGEQGCCDLADLVYITTQEIPSILLHRIHEKETNIDKKRPCQYIQNGQSSRPSILYRQPSNREHSAAIKSYQCLYIEGQQYKCIYGLSVFSLICLARWSAWRLLINLIAGRAAAAAAFLILLLLPFFPQRCLASFSFICIITAFFHYDVTRWQPSAASLLLCSQSCTTYLYSTPTSSQLLLAVGSKRSFIYKSQRPLLPPTNGKSL